MPSQRGRTCLLLLRGPLALPGAISTCTSAASPRSSLFFFARPSTAPADFFGYPPRRRRFESCALFSYLSPCTITPSLDVDGPARFLSSDLARLPAPEDGHACASAWTALFCVSQRTTPPDHRELHCLFRLSSASLVDLVHSFGARTSSSSICPPSHFQIIGSSARLTTVSHLSSLATSSRISSHHQRLDLSPESSPPSLPPSLASATPDHRARTWRLPQATAADHQVHRTSALQDRVSQRHLHHFPALYQTITGLHRICTTSL